MLIPKMGEEKTTDPSHHGQIQARFVICVQGLPPARVGFERFALGERKPRLLQLRDREGEWIGEVAGAHHKHIRLVPSETKTGLQGGLD